MTVRLEDVSGKPPLRIGMSATVEVDTGHARGLPTFLSDLMQHLPATSPAAASPAPKDAGHG